WRESGFGIVAAMVLACAVIGFAMYLWRVMRPGRLRSGTMLAVLICGFFLYRGLLDPAVLAVEANNPAQAGHIGGFGLPALWSWPVGAAFAAIAAWIIGRIALGLREDYLAVATLGIAEIVAAVMRNEDWLARGVKNLIDLPRPWPVPYEVQLQADPGYLARVTGL